jgi:hypothetical protein
MAASYSLSWVRRTTVALSARFHPLVFSAAGGFELLVSPGRSAGSVSTSLFRLKAKPINPEKTRMAPPIISQCGKPKDTIDLSRKGE